MFFTQNFEGMEFLSLTPPLQEYMISVRDAMFECESLEDDEHIKGDQYHALSPDKDYACQ